MVHSADKLDQKPRGLQLNTLELVDIFGNLVKIRLKENEQKHIEIENFSCRPLCPDLRLSSLVFDTDNRMSHCIYINGIISHQIIYNNEKNNAHSDLVRRRKNKKSETKFVKKIKAFQTYQNIMLKTLTTEEVHCSVVDLYGRYFEGTMEEGKIQEGMVLYSRCRKYRLERIIGTIYSGRIFEHNATYVGGLNNFTIEGYGKIFYEEDIEIFRGHFSNGLPNGPGILFDSKKQGNVLFKGIFG